MAISSPPMISRRRTRPILLAGLVLSLFVPSVSAQINITESTVASGDFVIGEGRVSYKFTIEGARTGSSQAEARIEPYWYIIYARGVDMYGNLFFQQLAQGLTNVLFGAVTGEGGRPATTQTFEGSWSSGDVTLLNYFPLRPNPQRFASHQIVLVLYGDGVTPATAPADNAAFLAPNISRAAGEIYWFVRDNTGPDLEMQGVTYNAGTYEGGDIIRMTTTWRNLIFPLGGYRQEIYKVHNYLTENASVDWRPPTDPSNPPDLVVPDNDDFLLAEYTMLGDRPVVSPVDTTPIVPDGSSIVRTVQVQNTPEPLPAYGIINTTVPFDPDTGFTYYDSSLRLYQPQPDDGWLDVGESVSVTVEVKVPQNYQGTYFVAGRVDPDNLIPEPVGVKYVNSGLFLEITDGQPDNNTFVSNPSAKITITPTEAPTVESVSAIAFEDGQYIQGGGETSDASSVTADGNVIAFASAARNLLVPPGLAEAFVLNFGRGADMTDVPTFGAAPYGDVGQYLTSNQQIFYRLRQTRENFLASGFAGVGANQNCFNPSINSGSNNGIAPGIAPKPGGRYIAFDSRASNLGVSNTGNRSFIYVTDTQNQTIGVVSRSSGVGDVLGALANGDCFNPSISANGRFVAFESLADNLDPARPLPSNSKSQIYLHDRDADGNGEFDEPGAGKTATYLVSVDADGQPANGACVSAVVNATESAARMYVAYVSTASSLPGGTGTEQIFRVSVDVGGTTPGPVTPSVVLVSENTNGEPSNRPAGAPNGSIEPSLSGDGSQIAFSSSADNLVYNPASGVWDADTNDVPDVFVRNLNLESSDSAYTLKGLVRVSESIPRVATGTIAFMAPSILFADPLATPFVPGSLVNIPQNNPQDGDRLEITTAGTTATFVFRTSPPPPGDVGIGPDVAVDFPNPVEVVTGRDVFGTRDNLINAINSQPGLELQAYATTPPTGTPNMAFAAAIYVRSLVLGENGNGTVTFIPATPLLPPATPVVVTDDLTGGGVQAEDAVLAVQGVPAGSNQPSISEDGRIVAFRSIAGNLDVNTLTPENDFGGGPPYNNTFQPSPRQGELIRPILFPASNVYVRNRQVDRGLPDGLDQEGNVSTTRVSLNNFGYPTTVSPQQGSGLGAFTTAANQAPAVGGNGRVISFSSGSEIYGGLVFGRNNLEPLDFQNARDVYVYDDQSVGEAPPPTESRPQVTLLSPADGLRVQPGSTIALAASVIPQLGKTIASVQFFVNGAPVGAPLTSEPYSLTYRLANAGQYVVRVVATDSRGITGAGSATVVAGAPLIGEPPLVALTQPPSQVSNYVVGSDLLFNASAQDADGSVTGVTFYLGGQPIPASQGFDGNWYASYRPAKTGTFSMFAAATDNDGNTSLTEISTVVFWGIGDSFPTVEIIPNSPGLPAVAGGEYPLRARITSQSPAFTFDVSNSSVLFYADGVYVGLGTLQADGTYLLNWRLPETPRSYAKIYAYLSAPNFFFLLDGGEDGGAPTSYASVVVRSKNFLSLTTAAGLPLDVSLIKPSNGAEIPAGVPTLLEASALAAGGQGTIARVEFYQNGELIGEADNTFPYQANFTPASPGLYSLVALAYSTAGVVQQSATVTVTAVQGSPPTVDLQVGGGRGADPVVAPALSVSRSGNEIALTMSAKNGVDYVLEETADLSTGIWAPSSAKMAAAADQRGVSQGYTRKQVSVPLGSGRKFFRVLYPSSVGGNFSVNQTATLIATADDSDGTVARVEFLVNGVVVQTVSASPYLHSYQLTAPGRYVIVARAYDNLGNVKDSDPTVITVTDGAAPAVVITEPVDGSSVTPGVPVTVTADASDTDGSVARVDLLVNGVVVGTDTQAPYVFTDAGQFSADTNTTFTPPSQGQYVIVARAVDNLGNVTDSPPVTVTATAPAAGAPTVQMTQPLGEIYYVDGSSYFLNARITDTPPGTINTNSVKFTVNGLPVTGSPLGIIANDYGVRYRPTNLFGIDAARAEALDNEGNRSISQPNYTVLSIPQYPLPAVTMLPLLPGTPTNAGGKIRLRAEAFFPSTASEESRVEFYANNVYVGTASNDPTDQALFLFDWATPTNQASYVVQARAVARNFQTAVGEGNVIRFFGSIISENATAVNTIPGVAPTVSIFEPTNSQTVNVNQPFTIRANATNSAGTIGRVEFYANGQLVGVDTNAVYEANFTPPSTGLYNLAAIAYTQSGILAVSDTVTVNSALGAPPTVALQAPATAAVGDTVILSAVPTPVGTGRDIKSVEFVVNNIVVATDTTYPYQYEWPVQSPGNYEIQARAIDNVGNVGLSSVSTLTTFYAPVVTLTASATNVRQGETVRLRARAFTDEPGESITSVLFLNANGTPLPSPGANGGPNPVTVQNSQGFYDYFYTASQPGTISLQAVATGSAGNEGKSDLVEITVEADASAPIINITSPVTSSLIQLNAPLVITAGASPGQGATITTVQFRVTNPDGVLTTLTPTQTDSPFSVVYAGVIKPGFYNITAQVFNSAGKSNVSNVVVQAILVPPPAPGTDLAFIDDMFRLLFYRFPTDDERDYWYDWLGSQDEDALAPLSKRADMVMELMGFDAAAQTFANTSGFWTPAVASYQATSAMALQPFGRLGITPTKALVEGFLAPLAADVALNPPEGRPLPLTSYSGDLIPGAPYGATYGMAAGMQSIFASTQFSAAYPNVLSLDNLQFVDWLSDVMFENRAVGNVFQVSSMMDTFDPQTQRQGAAGAFLTKFVVRQAASYGYLNPDSAAEERAFQLKLNSASLKFQLNDSGAAFWNYAVAPNYSKPVVEEYIQQYWDAKQ